MSPPLILFDIDGTLTQPMATVDPVILDALRDAKRRHPGLRLGIVGGSDRAKAEKQMGADVLATLFDVCFHENGAVVYRGHELAHADELDSLLDERDVKALTEFVLGWIAACDAPVKTGTFVERRRCALNVSPIGRGCSQEQRHAFAEWDRGAKCRERLVEAIHQKFPDLAIDLAIGGEISVDIVPRGFDKTRCLVHLPDIDEIVFIGDRTAPGGNDHALYIHPRVRGITTTGPADTIRLLDTVLF